jgi:hypothetical protein
VFPRTAGTRWEPALAFEVPSVTWKYRGTENIIYTESGLGAMLEEKCTYCELGCG